LVSSAFTALRVLQKHPSELIILLTSSLVCFLSPFYAAAAEKDAVARLQDAFSAGAAERKVIYSEVVALVDRLRAGGSPVESKALLARAAALKQMAMDAEDEFLDRMKSSAPDFRKLAWSNPSFPGYYRKAAEQFKKLQAEFPFIEPYGESAARVSEGWHDGQALFRAAVSFKEIYPASRFGKRLLLLAGCRLLLEKKYAPAREAFQRLWREAPLSTQAVTAYSLVDALGSDKAPPGPIRLSAANRLAWGRALGLSGAPVLSRLIELHPGSGEAEEACYQIFSDINRGFAQRSLSNNYRQAKRFDRYFNNFTSVFPRSRYLEKALELGAIFHYRCGRKSQAIARKNDYRWRKSRRSLSRRVSRKYSSFAERHFSRVAALDSLAAVKFPGSRCFFRVGLACALSMIERDRFDPAAAKLKALLAEGPDSLSLNSILWYSGLIQYEKGDFQAAADYLARLEKSNYRDAEFWSRGMLFLGKSFLALGDSLAAGRVFGILSRAYPYTFYGIRARFLQSSLSPKFAVLKWLDFPLNDLARFPGNYTPAGEKFQQEASQWQSLGFFA